MLMAEFAKYRLLVKVVVKHDALGEIKWEQRVFLGNLEYGCELHLIDFAAFVRAGGGTGLTIPRPRECSPVLDQAFSTPGRVWRKP
jgi:thiamine pyrophosphate-dependent acetolactate synthase large subunit-like protein